MSMKVTIDGIPVEVEPGTTILNAARQIGGDIVPPAMCYYSKLKDSGGKQRLGKRSASYAKAGSIMPYHRNGWNGSTKHYFTGSN
jgi:hypothetical protein